MFRINRTAINSLGLRASFTAQGPGLGRGTFLQIIRHTRIRHDHEATSVSFDVSSTIYWAS